MSNEYKKCSKENGFCQTLNSMVQPAGSHKKGLVAIETINLEDGVWKLIGCAYKEDHNDRGVMLNTCPWCSESIEWFK